MTWENVLLFTITVLPLICTLGSDIMFAVSQGLSNGRNAVIRSVAGLLLGYTAHALLSAVGVAAIVAASPTLFVTLKWFGVAYLSFQMLRSACTNKDQSDIENVSVASLWRGFFTSFLNPKGLLMYLAILPQFITPEGSALFQSLIYSAIFITGCAVVYGTVGLLAARSSDRRMTDKSCRRIEGFAGTLLAGAALKIASQ